MKTIFNTFVTDVSDTDKEGVGALRVEGNKTYKWVKYDDGSANLAAAVGDVVGYKTGGYATQTVTSDASDCDGIGAGVLMAAPADGQFCWIQIKGQATCSTAFVGPPVAGNGLKFSVSDRAFNVGAAATDTIVAACTHVVNKTVILDCPA